MNTTWGIILVVLGAVVAGLVQVLLGQRKGSEEQQHTDALKEAMLKAKDAFGRDTQAAEAAEKAIEVHRNSLQQIYNQSGLSADEIAARFRKLGL